MNTSLLLFVAVAIVMVLIALGFVLLPLLGGGRHKPAQEGSGDALQARAALKVLREQMLELQADHQAGRVDDATLQRNREELELRALHEGIAHHQAMGHRASPAWAIGIAVVLPASALALYLLLGTPQGVDSRNVHAAPASQQGAEMDDMREMIAALAQRLQKEGGTAQNWAMLGRSYIVIQDYAKAVEAFATASKLEPDNPDYLASQAEAVAMEQGSITAEAQALAQKALSLNDSHITALLILGSAAQAQKNFAAAADYWERALVQIPPDEDIADGLRNAIAQARTMAAQQTTPAPPVPDAAAEGARRP